MNRHFTEEDKEGNKRIKRCLTLLLIGKMQIKPTMTQPNISTRIDKIKK